MKTYPVVEVFGPTIQGEGAAAGKLSHFVRFGGCDFKCEWCDSSHAVLPEEVRKADKLTILDIMNRLNSLSRAEYVTLSGGNPAMHEGLAELINLIQYDLKMRVAVETQGSLWKDWLRFVDLLTISPKPPSAAQASDKLFPLFMKKLESEPWVQPQRVIIKVPIYSINDYLWAMDLRQQYSRYDFALSIVTLMGGLDGKFADGQIDTIAEVLRRYRKVVDWVLAEPDKWKNTTILPQLHVLLWGHARGV